MSKAKNIIEKFKSLTMEAGLYIENPDKEDNYLPDLQAIMRGVRMTNIGREVYFEQVKAKHEKPAKKAVDIPDTKTVLAMNKEALTELAASLSLSFDESMKKNDLISLIENCRNVSV